MGQKLFFCFYGLFSLRSLCIWNKIKQKCLACRISSIATTCNLFCPPSSLTARRRDCRPWLLGETSSSSLWTIPRRWSETSWKRKANQKTGNFSLKAFERLKSIWKHNDLMVGSQGVVLFFLFSFWQDIWLSQCLSPGYSCIDRACNRKKKS